MQASPYAHAAKPFTWAGVKYPSITDFARQHGLHVCTVNARVKRGVTDERLVTRGRLK
jgi:hypothetical protein